MIILHEDCFAGDCIYVHTIKHRKVYPLTYYEWYLVWNEMDWSPTAIFFGILNFGIRIPISWFFNSGIKKKIPTRIFGIKNRIRVPLPIGVPEIGTKNWNSQPRCGRFATYVLLCQEEYKEWNGVHLQLQLGLGKRTGSNSLLVRVR